MKNLTSKVLLVSLILGLKFQVQAQTKVEVPTLSQGSQDTLFTEQWRLVELRNNRYIHDADYGSCPNQLKFSIIADDTIRVQYSHGSEPEQVRLISLVNSGIISQTKIAKAVHLVSSTYLSENDLKNEIGLQAKLSIESRFGSFSRSRITSRPLIRLPRIGPSGFVPPFDSEKKQPYIEGLYLWNHEYESFQVKPHYSSAFPILSFSKNLVIPRSTKLGNPASVTEQFTTVGTKVPDKGIKATFNQNFDERKNMLFPREECLYFRAQDIQN